MLHEMGIETGIDLSRMTKIACDVEEVVGRRLAKSCGPGPGFSFTAWTTSPRPPAEQPDGCPNSS